MEMNKSAAAVPKAGKAKDRPRSNSQANVGALGKIDLCELHKYVGYFFHRSTDPLLVDLCVIWPVLDGKFVIGIYIHYFC